MALTLPEARDVVFDKSPIKQVICQVRFPPILRIESERPADFQDKIRGDYAQLTMERGFELDIEAAAQQEPNAVQRPVVTPPLWAFTSGDGRWTVSLTTTFVALTTDETYQTFPEFSKRFTAVLTAFLEAYEAPYGTRVGLRYINEIPEPEGASSNYWVERLQPLYVGAFQSDAVRGDVLRLAQELRVAHAQDEVTIRHGYIGRKPPDTSAFILDFDMYRQGEVPFASVPELLVRFNETIFGLFLWSMKGVLPAELGERPRTG